MGKRKWLWPIVIISVLAVVLALAISRQTDQELISEHMYPQQAIHKNSNLSIRGVVTSIEENRTSFGLGIDSYHIFRFYVQMNITEIVWIHEGWMNFPTDNRIEGRSSIVIGYDNLDNPQLFVGQAVECKGYYLPLTDTPYSFKITVAPSITESYLKPQS